MSSCSLKTLTAAIATGTARATRLTLKQVRKALTDIEIERRALDAQWRFGEVCQALEEAASIKALFTRQCAKERAEAILYRKQRNALKALPAAERRSFGLWRQVATIKHWHEIAPCEMDDLMTDEFDCLRIYSGELRSGYFPIIVCTEDGRFMSVVDGNYIICAKLRTAELWLYTTMRPFCFSSLSSR